MAREISYISNQEAMNRAIAALYRNSKKEGYLFEQPSSGKSEVIKITDAADPDYLREYVVLAGGRQGGIIAVYRIQYLTDGNWRLKRLERIPGEITAEFED